MLLKSLNKTSTSEMLPVPGLWSPLSVTAVSLGKDVDRGRPLKSYPGNRGVLISPPGNYELIIFAFS